MEPTTSDIKHAERIIKKENYEARKNSNGVKVKALRKSELKQLAIEKAIELKNQEN